MARFARQILILRVLRVSVVNLFLPSRLNLRKVGGSSRWGRG